MFISIFYMFRAAMCPSSGESIVSIRHLVYVTLYRWQFSVQVIYTEWHIPDVELIQLTLYLLTWRIWCAPNNASKGQMGFNSAFKGFIVSKTLRLMKRGSYNIKCVSFLGVFPELQKAAISFSMSGHLSTWNKLAPTEGFSWNVILECFLNSAKKIQISLKSS